MDATMSQPRKKRKPKITAEPQHSGGEWRGEPKTEPPPPPPEPPKPRPFTPAPCSACKSLADGKNYSRVYATVTRSLTIVRYCRCTFCGNTFKQTEVRPNQ